MINFLNIASLRDSIESHLEDSVNNSKNLTGKFCEYESICKELKSKYDELKSSINSKANRESVASALHRKANKQDISSEILFGNGSKTMQLIAQNLQKEFMKYATIDDLRRLFKLVEDKTDFEDFGKLEKVNLQNPNSYLINFFTMLI